MPDKDHVLLSDFERLAFLHAPDATLVLRKRVILAANARVEAVFGWSPQALTGQSIRMLYPGETDYEAVGARARRAMQQVGVYRDERFMRRKDGQVVWMEGSGTALDPADPEKLAIWSYRPLRIEDNNASLLTAAEKKVARYLVNGLTSKEIAQTIGCSPRTVEVHRANMIRKLDVRNSFELVRKLLTTPMFQG